MRNKFYLNLVFLFLFFILIIPQTMAVADKSVQTTINQNTGLTIEYPKFVSISTDKDLEWHFHVFNITDGVIVSSSTTSCQGELLDVDGKILTELFAESREDHFYFNVSSGNFSKPGSLPYLLYCNTTNLGGFVSGNLIITENGIEPSDTANPTEGSLSVTITLLATSIIFIYLGLTLFRKKDSEEERGIAKFATPIRLMFLMVGIFILAQNIQVTRFILEANIVNINAVSFSKLTHQMDSGYNIIMIISRVLIYMVGIGFLVWVFNKFKDMPKVRRNR